MDNRTTTYVIGDIHGQQAKLIRLLRNVHLIGDDLAWIGQTATLWFMGDFVDRGPDGMAVIDLVMAWQRQADLVGGKVASVLGNHEVALLAAHRFAAQRSTGPAGTFLGDWTRNGGVPADLQQLTPRHIDWIMALPAMAERDGYLLAHADATFYTEYGQSTSAVNQAFQRLLQSDDPQAWDRLLAQFSRRNAFSGFGDGAGRAARFLATFGARQLIHGHTPISTVTTAAPESVTEPLIYAGGRCVNVDGGMYLGGPGVVYLLEGKQTFL